MLIKSIVSLHSLQILGLHKHAPGEVHDHGFEIPDYTWKLVVAVAALWVLFMFENGLKLFSSKPYVSRACFFSILYFLGN